MSQFLDSLRIATQNFRPFMRYNRTELNFVASVRQRAAAALDAKPGLRYTFGS
jgi:hypothetical protein